MINDSNTRYHFNESSSWQWVETIALPLAVPAANMNATVYVVARPRLGVYAVDITIMDRITDLWEEQLYIDNMQHLPCPSDFANFTLDNGLRIRSVDATRFYRVDYKGFDDTRLHLEYRALHEPYDINDPAMDPTARTRGRPAWDTSWSGHYDLTYRITGELIARGQRYEVDCVDTGDRNWGPRAERDNSAVIWWHASFGEELTCHLFTAHDLATRNSMGPHVSGYILENGETFGIVGSEGTQEYRKAMPVGGRVDVEDVRGERFRFTFSTVNGCYWAPYPSNTYLQASMRVAHEDRVANGAQQIGLSRAYMTRHRDQFRQRA
ncbi:MAG: hypothetical protein NVSMB6_26420 [Burkholderiaceae bacterium]